MRWCRYSKGIKWSMYNYESLTTLKLPGGMIEYCQAFQRVERSIEWHCLGIQTCPLKLVVRSGSAKAPYLLAPWTIFEHQLHRLQGQLSAKSEKPCMWTFFLIRGGLQITSLLRLRESNQKLTKKGWWKRLWPLKWNRSMWSLFKVSKCDQIRVCIFSEPKAMSPIYHGHIFRGRGRQNIFSNVLGQGVWPIYQVKSDAI